MFDWITVLQQLGVPQDIIDDAQKVGYDLKQLMNDLINESIAFVRLKIQALLHKLPDPNQGKKAALP